MWKLVILASAAVSTFGNPTGPELFRLSAPYNLRTGNESETSVVLRWHFDKPKDIPLSDVRFRIRLDQWPQAISFPYEDAPLNFTLNHLLPGESYTAYLVALCAYCHDSPPVNISFTTMEKDWPTPIITNVTLSSSEDAENGVSYYEVMWEELPQRWLFYIKIEICDPACIEYTEEPTANSTFVPVKSFAVFTVRLCAVYNEMVVGRIKRCSIYFQAFPDTPVAKAILRWASVSRPMISGPKSMRNTNLLPKGTRTYYEFLVCDPSLQSKEPNARTIPVGSTTSSPELIQAEERVRIIDPGLLQRLTSLSYSDQACQLDEQVQFKIARRTQKAKRFRIVFETHTAVWFDLENKAQRLLLAPGFAKTLNLAPFKPINFLIRNCLFHPKFAVNNCGNYTASDIVSTVAEPSVVQEAKRTLVARGLLAISWQEPAEPRGPIHGYKIEFRRKIGGQITRKFEFVVPTQRSLLFPLPMGGAEIWISVAAFNLDIDDKTEMLLGEWVNAGPEESRYYPMIVVVVLSVVLPVMLFGGIEYYFAKLRSRRRLHQISVPVQRFGRDFDATAFPEEMHVIRTPPVRFRQAPHQAPIAEEESSL